MTPAFPLGVAASWARLVTVFVADVGLLWAGVMAAGRAGWWAGAVMASVLSVAALCRWRGAVLLDLVWGALRRSRVAIAAGGQLADFDRTFGPSQGVGIRGAGAELVAVVAVDGPAHSPSVLDYPRVQSLAKLPLEAVAAGLRQSDVMLEGIDILSVGSRRAQQSHHPYAPVYSSVVGDHPAVGQRRTVLVVRFNALRGAASVVWRESVAATVSAAAEWLAAELTSLRIPARVLTAAQISEADEALLAGADPSSVQSRWGRVRHSGGYVHTYWVSPQEMSTGTLDRLWAPDCEATVVSVQLRPAPSGATTVGVMVRYHTGGPLSEPPLTGLNPLSGRHATAMVAGLIRAGQPVRLPARQLRAGESITVPIAATGIIIGTTATGHPLLVDLADATQSSTVTIAGEFALTVQVALRAAATGYQVLVCSERPQRWQQASGAGLQVVGSGGLGPTLPASRYPWLVVYDGVSEQAAADAAVTVRTVGPRSGSTADIHIEQDGPAAAVIRTWAFQYRLRVNLDYERRLLTATAGHAA